MGNIKVQKGKYKTKKYRKIMVSRGINSSPTKNCDFKTSLINITTMKKSQHI